jgi:L-alanine-DL-glutamate epimerase-like enolase superfamily enzyme
VRVRDVDVLHCDAGWRVWSFVKLTTDDGLVGYAECTESLGSRRGIEAVVRELAPLVVGKDPRPIERRLWELEAATRQSPGGVVQKALAGIENALLDVKGKALGVPVYELYGGPLRDDVGVYWSHCGTSRVRAHELVGEAQVRTYEDLTALAREVVARGFRALKTNVIVLEDEPFVYMPGFNRSAGGPDLPPDREIIRALRQRCARAFRPSSSSSST